LPLETTQMSLANRENPNIKKEMNGLRVSPSWMEWMSACSSCPQSNWQTIACQYFRLRLWIWYEMMLYLHSLRETAKVTGNFQSKQSDE
jgi:hypothetical protein